MLNIHYAAQHGNTDEVQTLIRQGTDVNAKGYNNGRGQTALHYAAWNGHEATVQLLLDNGAQVNAEADDGRTALHCAAWNGHEATTQLLLDNGARVDVMDKKGKTALHEAARYGHQATVRVLLDNGAHVETKDNQGKTPLDYARSDAMRQILTTHQQQPPPGQYQQPPPGQNQGGMPVAGGMVHGGIRPGYPPQQPGEQQPPGHPPQPPPGQDPSQPPPGNGSHGGGGNGGGNATPAEREAKLARNRAELKKLLDEKAKRDGTATVDEQAAVGLNTAWAQSDAMRRILTTHQQQPPPGQYHHGGGGNGGGNGGGQHNQGGMPVAGGMVHGGIRPGYPPQQPGEQQPPPGQYQQPPPGQNQQPPPGQYQQPPPGQYQQPPQQPGEQQPPPGQYQQPPPGQNQQPPPGQNQQPPPGQYQQPPPGQYQGGMPVAGGMVHGGIRPGYPPQQPGEQQQGQYPSGLKIVIDTCTLQKTPLHEIQEIARRNVIIIPAAVVNELDDQHKDDRSGKEMLRRKAFELRNWMKDVQKPRPSPLRNTNVVFQDRLEEDNRFVPVAGGHNGRIKPDDHIKACALHSREQLLKAALAGQGKDHVSQVHVVMATDDNFLTVKTNTENIPAFSYMGGHLTAWSDSHMQQVLDAQKLKIQKDEKAQAIGRRAETKELVDEGNALVRKGNLLIQQGQPQQQDSAEEMEARRTLLQEGTALKLKGEALMKAAQGAGGGGNGPGRIHIVPPGHSVQCPAHLFGHIIGIDGQNLRDVEARVGENCKLTGVPTQGCFEISADTPDALKAACRELENEKSKFSPNKTAFCDHYDDVSDSAPGCRFGPRCRFAHSADEMDHEALASHVPRRGRAGARDNNGGRGRAGGGGGVPRRGRAGARDNNGGRGRAGGGGGGDRTCYTCGQPGHMSRECPQGGGGNYVHRADGGGNGNRAGGGNYGNRPGRRADGGGNGGRS